MDNRISSPRLCHRRHRAVMLLAITLMAGQSVGPAAAQVPEQVPRGLSRNGDGTYSPAPGYQWVESGHPSSLAVQLFSARQRAFQGLADQGDAEAQYELGVATSRVTRSRITSHKPICGTERPQIKATRARSSPSA